MIGTILDYLRMVCYAIIVLTDLNGIFKRKFTNLLFVGDIIMAFAMLLVLFHTNFLNRNLEKMTDFLLTPAAIVWAGVHLFSMIKHSHVKTTKQLIINKKK